MALLNFNSSNDATSFMPAEDQATLRNHDDLYVQFARTNFVERLPLISFPKTWNNLLVDPNLLIIRNKLEFKLKILKKHRIDKLSEEINCQ